MKYAATLVAIAALSLSACASEEPATEETDTAVAEATETATGEPTGSVAFTAGQPPSREFMTGIWGEGDDCELPIDFQADGTIKDGPFATWELKDGQLSMDDAVTLQLTVVDEDTMESQNEGSTEPTTLKRCG